VPVLYTHGLFAPSLVNGGCACYYLCVASVVISPSELTLVLSNTHTKLKSTVALRHSQSSNRTFVYNNCTLNIYIYARVSACVCTTGTSSLYTYSIFYRFPIRRNSSFQFIRIYRCCYSCTFPTRSYNYYGNCQIRNIFETITWKTFDENPFVNFDIYSLFSNLG